MGGAETGAGVGSIFTSVSGTGDGVECCGAMGIGDEESACVCHSIGGMDFPSVFPDTMSSGIISDFLDGRAACETCAWEAGAWEVATLLLAERLTTSLFP